MPQLYGKIKFNGRLLDKYEVVSVETSSERKLGLNTSIEYEDGIGNVPLFVKRKKDIHTIPIQLSKCDNRGNLLKITDDDICELSRLLYSKDDIGILECNGLVYYGHFVGLGSGHYYESGVGYITLNYQLSSPYCYSSVMLDTIHVKNEKYFEIYNKSNASESIFADLEIEMVEGTSFKILNLTNGEEFSIEDIESNEQFTIYGDSREIVSKNSDKNMFKLCNRKFKALNLVYGRNMFKIISNDCKVKMIYQNEICLY